MDSSLVAQIRIEVLLNARLHAGSPNGKAVLGKVLGQNAELRSQVKEVMDLVNKLVDEINQMSLDEITSDLNQLSPDAVKSHEEKKSDRSQKRRDDRKKLPDLKNAVKGRVVVRYAPDPSKYPHLGQGMNYLINRIYADKYDGKVILRFDDTNPTNVKPIYYDAIKEGMKWLGATWDVEIRASQFLEDFYTAAKKLIQTGDLYVCFCENELMKANRENSLTCVHRSHNSEINLKEFDKMITGKYKVGNAIVRLTGDLESDNHVMRDPVMLRIVKDQHPMLNTFYYVFPTYDFESAFLETKFEITHVIRSGEFGTMRQELQSYLIDKFGGEIPEFVSFGRFNIQGSPTQGRIIRELVESKVVSGWDDIRLFTLVGLKKRGIHPDTARLLIQEAGLTAKNATIAWSTLESKSKELLEPRSKRYFFVEDPIKLKVENFEAQTLVLPIHPDHLELGNRNLNITGEFYLSQLDTEKLIVGDEIRLKDLFNIKISEMKSKIITAEYTGNKIERLMTKIQWVTGENLRGTLQVPLLLQPSKNKINQDSMLEISGKFEASISKIDLGEIVQLERVGFAKLSIVNNKVVGHIVHSHN